MALTPSEEHAIREIEHQLEVNDPKFVERLHTIVVSRSPHWLLGLIIGGAAITFEFRAGSAAGPHVVAGVALVVAGWLFGRTGWGGLVLTAVRLRGRWTRGVRRCTRRLGHGAGASTEVKRRHIWRRRRRHRGSGSGSVA